MVAAFVASLGWEAAAMVAFLVLLVALYGAVCCRALRPRPGTLEWIARYDRPALSLAGRWQRLGRRDALALPAACLVSLAAWGFAAWQSVRALYPDGGLPAAAVWEMAVYYGLLPVLTVAAAYVLIRGLYGSSMAALLAALTLGLDLTADPLVVLLVAVPALLLVRYLTAPAEAPFGAVCLRLILAFAASAVGWRAVPGLAVVPAVLLLLLLAGAAGRFVELGRGWLLKGLAAALLSLAVTTVLAWVPAGAAAGMPVPQLLVSGEFYAFAARSIGTGLTNTFTASPAWLVTLLRDWPLLLCGLAAGIAAVGALVRRRDFRGLMAALWLAALLALWILGGVYAAPFGCMLCLGGVWGTLCSRGRPRLALFGGCVLLALLLGQYTASWIVW